MMEKEGVIKFSMVHTPLLHTLESDVLSELMIWRDLSRALHFLGQDPERYQGYGYGNISARENTCAFLISASQTSGLLTSDISLFSRVTNADIDHNRLFSEGIHPPSSESMTHAAIYQQDSDIQWILHSHCPEIWRCADVLNIPATAANIPYGTPEMARAVQSLIHQHFMIDKQVTKAEKPASEGIFVMNGHQDGVVSFGASAERTIALMVDHYAQAIRQRSID